VCDRLTHSHHAVPDGRNPENLSGIASDQGQQVKLWCKEIQNLLRFTRGARYPDYRDQGESSVSVSNLFLNCSKCAKFFPLDG